jgi:hypothetical protein
MPRNASLLSQTLSADAAAAWSPDSSRLRRWILGAAALFALLLISVQAVQSWRGYRIAITQAETRASDLAYILAAHMRESVAALDSSLVQIGVANRRLSGPNRAAISTCFNGSAAGPTPDW